MAAGTQRRGGFMPDQTDYNKAKKAVEAKISFLIHLAVYILVNTLLVIINLNTSPGTLWFKWTLIGWGIGLVIHGLSVFVGSGLSNLKERMIEKEIKKQNRL